MQGAGVEIKLWAYEPLAGGVCSHTSSADFLEPIFSWRH